jgi:hypothetical protein
MNKRVVWAGLAAVAAAATMSLWVSHGGREVAGGAGAALAGSSVPTPPIDAQASTQPGPVAALESAPSSVPAPPAAGGASASAKGTTTTAPAPLLSTEELAEVRRALADHPDAEAEVQRVVAYLQFTRQWQRLLAARQAGADPQALRTLAASLDAALPQHLLRRELSAAEAGLVKGTLLEVLVPDSARRAAALGEWQRDVAAQQIKDQPQRAAAAAAERTSNAAFQARQVQVVAAWQALPAAQRDPARLEAELDTLRRQTFNPPTDGGSR